MSSSIIRDRLAEIRNIHLRSLIKKPKVARVAKEPKAPRLPKAPKEPRPPREPRVNRWPKNAQLPIDATPEQIAANRAYHRAYKIEYRKARRAAGMCLSCNKKAVVHKFEYEGMVILTQFAQNCPDHWRVKETKEQFQQALVQPVSSGGI